MSVLRRMLCMCEPSWQLLRKGLILSCVFALCAFMLLMDAGTLTEHSYYTYLLAREFVQAPQIIMLIAIIGGVMIEERRVR